MVNQAHLLDRRPHRDGPELTLAGGLRVARARVHEICGAARWVFALEWAGRTSGPVMWIKPAWSTETLFAPGLGAWCDPTRILTVKAGQTRDILWAMEEALDSGAVSAVISEVSEIPELTPIRRLHLAAERGAQKGAEAPIGILLTPERGGAPGVETRWMVTPLPSGHPAWRLDRVRARMATPASWTMARDRTGALTLTPTTGPD